MRPLLNRCRLLIDGKVQVNRAAPPFYLSGLFYYLPLDGICKLLPHVDQDTHLSRVMIACRRRGIVSFGGLAQRAFLTSTCSENETWEFDLLAEEDPPQVLICWGDIGPREYGLRNSSIVRIDKIANRIWSHRLDRLSFSRLERYVLGATPDFQFQGPQARRGVFVTCGLLVHLAHAAQVPSLFDIAEDVAGLGLLTKDLRLAAHCLARARGQVSQYLEAKLERHVDWLASIQPKRSLRVAPFVTATDIPREVELANAVRCEESARRDRRRMYTLLEWQEMYRFRDERPLHTGIKPSKPSKLKNLFGFPKNMRPEHYSAVFRAERVAEEDVEEIFNRLTVGNEHDRYFKPFMHEDGPGKPAWRHDKYKFFGLRHLLNHLLHRGSWEGYAPEYVLSSQEAEADESLSPYPEKVTHVLVVDLDKHGLERLTVEERFHIIYRKLPGGLPFRSSTSGGIHIWYFLPEPVLVVQLVDRVLECLGDVRSTLGHRNTEASGWELKPDIRGNNNIRLFGGLGSAPLDEDLQPLDIGLAGLVDHVLQGARRQESELAYLLERPAVSSRRSPSRHPGGNMQATSFHQIPEGRSSPSSTARIPLALVEMPVPSLLRDGDPGCWANRCVIVGRALGAIGDQTSDQEVAWALIKCWLLSPSNAFHSKHLSSLDTSRIEARLEALRWVFDRLWPIRHERGHENRRTGISLQDVEPTAEDREHASRLAQAFGLEMGLHEDDSRLDQIEEVLLDVARLAARAVPLEDGTKVAIAGQQFWLNPPHGRWKLSTRRKIRIRDNPLYYRHIIDFLIKRGVLTPLMRARRQTSRYRIIWPAPEPGGDTAAT